MSRWRVLQRIAVGSASVREKYDRFGCAHYDGLNPFELGTDVDSARRGLADALALARERIDDLLGPRQWTWIDSPAEKAGPCHVGDDRGGIDFSRQGMTMGVPRSVFGELVDVVREEVGPLGFTETVDISAGETGEVNLFNVDDGGYVGIVLSGGPRAFSMRYTTGCRPFPKDRPVPEDAPAANAGRAEAQASGVRGRTGADTDGVDALNSGRPGDADRRLGNAESFGASAGEPKVGRHSEAAGEFGSAGRRRQGRHRASLRNGGDPAVRDGGDSAQGVTRGGRQMTHTRAELSGQVEPLVQATPHTQDEPAQSWRIQGEAASPDGKPTSTAPDATEPKRDARDGWTSRWPMVDD